MKKTLMRLNIKHPVIFKALLALVLVGGVILLVLYINMQRNTPAVIIADEPAYEIAIVYEEEIIPVVYTLAQDEEEYIAVYVSGNVYSPGVFYFTQGARIRDAIESAGGMTQYADPSAINLADFLFDTQHIFVFGLDDGRPPATSNERTGSIGGGGQAADDRININTATAEQLQTLSGIGPSRSEAIIRHREARGGFNNIQEIMNVSGIGQSIFNDIEDRIYVN